MTPCTTTDLDWHSTDPDEAAACIALCATCPERAPCAADALARREEHGIWGGLDLNRHQSIRPRGRPRRTA